MKFLLSIFVVCVLVAPLCAETVLLSEDFEAGIAGNPIADGVSGWTTTGTKLGYLMYSDVTIDSGLSAADGANNWPYEHLAFVHTPAAGEVYTLSAVMYSPDPSYPTSTSSYTSLRIDNANGTDTGLGGCVIDIGAGVLGFWLPTGDVVAAHPGDQVMDVKMDISTEAIDCYYRVHGAETWTLAGSKAGVDISQLDEVTMCMLGGGAGHISNIDTIMLTSSASDVPEPSTLVLLAMGLIGLACAWRKR